MPLLSVKSLPLEWIRVFEAAGRSGSFTAAAIETGLTQAAVSQRIRGLEARIGTDLFTRQARGVTLTVDGEAWLPYVAHALQTLDRSVDELFGKPLKKLVILASASVIQLWITPRLARLTGGTRYMVSLATMNVEADFARADSMVEIRYGDGSWPAMRAERLFDEALSPLAAPSLLTGGVDWQHLPRIAVVGPRPGWHEWADRTAQAINPIPVLRFDSMVQALAAARSGAGVVLGSLPLAAAYLADGALVRVSETILDLSTGYWMTSKDGRLPTKAWQDLKAALCGPAL